MKRPLRSKSVHLEAHACHMDENGSPGGIVELELVKVSPKKITMRGHWKEGHETGDVSILLSGEPN